MRGCTQLTDLEVLALDCQATGANPDRGHLLEIGWISGWKASASMPQIAAAASHLIQLPAQTPIPPVVQRLTGVSQTAMTSAVPAKEAWRRLRQTALANAAANQSVLCPTVIHFARFEVPYLHRLHAAHNPDTSFPFATICTHAIATRLLPGLPRKGIRALAGYLGHCAHLIRRARWYCQLSESSVAWASAENPLALRNLIMFEKGRIVHKGVLPEGRKVPDPPGFGRSWDDRRLNLDLAAYDRMRVVTTELRRLLCEGRRIEVCLGPKESLRTSALEKGLQWV